MSSKQYSVNNSVNNNLLKNAIKMQNKIKVAMIIMSLITVGILIYEFVRQKMWNNMSLSIRYVVGGCITVLALVTIVYLSGMRNIGCIKDPSSCEKKTHTVNTYKLPGPPPPPGGTPPSNATYKTSIKGMEKIMKELNKYG